MISGQTIQSSIDEARAITRMDFCVFDGKASLVAETFDTGDISEEAVSAFIQSPVENQTLTGYHFFKIFCEEAIEYILITRGLSEDAYMIGRLVASQLQTLAAACQKRPDRTRFLQDLLSDKLLPADICSQAKKLHINQESSRMVYLIQTAHKRDAAALETVRNLFGSSPEDYIIAIDEKNMVLLKEIAFDEPAKKLEAVARTLVDMLNAEAMTQARVSYGSAARQLRDVSKSYKEAKMAMDVCRIFYSDKVVMAYGNLGIGRLLYQLPQSLCERFIHEIFGENTPDSFDEETLHTVYKLFENGLNLSETARQLFVHRNTLVYRLEKLQKITGLDVRVFEDAMTFKIALMVFNYIKDREGYESERSYD